MILLTTIGLLALTIWTSCNVPDCHIGHIIGAWISSSLLIIAMVVCWDVYLPEYAPFTHPTNVGVDFNGMHALIFYLALPVLAFVLGGPLVVIIMVIFGKTLNMTPKHNNDA